MGISGSTAQDHWAQAYWGDWEKAVQAQTWVETCRGFDQEQNSEPSGQEVT